MPSLVTSSRKTTTTLLLTSQPWNHGHRVRPQTRPSLTTTTLPNHRAPRLRTSTADSTCSSQPLTRPSHLDAPPSSQHHKHLCSASRLSRSLQTQHNHRAVKPPQPSLEFILVGPITVLRPPLHRSSTTALYHHNLRSPTTCNP